MKRNIYPILRDMIADKERTEVMIIEGSRQAGKSYLVNSVLQDMSAPFYAFDLEKDRRLCRRIAQTENFIDFKTLMCDQYGVKNHTIMFLDEVQECRRIASYVKSFKEDWPEIKVILTGSSMNRFFTKETRIPVGRTRSLCVYPFSFSEFLRCTGQEELADFVRSAPRTIPASRHGLLLKLFDEYLVVGGYPEAVKAYAARKSYDEIVEEIMAMLEEDFARKEEYQPALFNSVIRAVANHVGSLSKYTHIDATKYHAKRVIEAMKAWHIVLEVQPYSIDSHGSDYLPKRYLHDIGVLNRNRSLAAPTISILDTTDPRLRTPLGGLFENAVLLNLLEGESAHKSIGTWKKGRQTDIEVDFVLDMQSSGTRIPVECKATLVLKKRHLSNVIHYLALTGQTTGIVVSAAPFEKITTETGLTVINVPVYIAAKDNIKAYASDMG